MLQCVAMDDSMMDENGNGDKDQGRQLFVKCAGGDICVRVLLSARRR